MSLFRARPIALLVALSLASLGAACVASGGDAQGRQRASQGEGDWCPDDGLYCGGDHVEGGTSTLYRCAGHVLRVEQACGGGCQVNPDPQDDACKPEAPPNECPNDGLYCGGDSIGGDPGTLYRCAGHRLTVEQACADGCSVQPAGVDDACKSAPASGGGGDFGDVAVSRALQWVDAGMPYCGGVNGGGDVLCGGTCWRGGSASNPAWDRYRSDCSGLVSWAWQLPAPGRTTYGFAPFDAAVSYEIAGDDLQPGDALNNDEHVVLFAGWVDRGAGKARIIEEYNCGHVATDHVLTLSVNASTSVYVSDWSPHSYSAIRAVR